MRTSTAGSRGATLIVSSSRGVRGGTAVPPHSLAFLLLGVGQILDLVGLCALSCSVAACCLRSVKVRFGHLSGILLTRPTRGLPFSRGCFGGIDALGSHFG